MASNLAKLTWSEILKVKQDGQQFSTIQGNLKALDSAMTILKKAREERWAVLGLDKEKDVDSDDLPELVVSELTVEQIEAIRAQDAEQVDGLEEEPVLELDEDFEIDESSDEIVEEG